MQWSAPNLPCLYQSNPTTWKSENGRVGIKIDGPGCVTELIPNNFNFTEGMGYSYSFDMEFTNTVVADRNVIFRYLNSSNWYDLKFYGSDMWFQKVVDSYYRLEKTSYSFQDNQIYHFRIEFSNIVIKIFINDILVWELADSPPYFSGGTIGFQASVGANPDSEVWFDNVVVKSLDPVPTPAPTPSVILVPGMGASWNADALLNCKSDGYDGGWSMSAFAADIYGPLVSALNGAGINVSVFNYDWRKEIPDNQPGLRGFIDGLGGKFSLVGHSMGGLLGRAYLESAGNNSKLTDLITVGSPHRGSALAYPVWSAGEIWDRSPLTKIAATLLLKRCGSTKRTDKQVIQTYWPSVHNLLPIDNYLRDINSGNLIPVDSMAARNNWQPTNFLSYGVHVGTLSGVSMDTLQNIPVKDRSKIDAVLGDWEDGKLMGKEMTSQGDGVVLASNAILLGADNRSISGTHLGIVSSADGVNQILNLLGITTSATQAVWQEPKSALVVIGNNARLILTDPKGKIRSDSNGVTSVINPATGNYKYFLVPKKFQSELIVIQVKNNGDVLYNEYKFNDFLPKFGTIEF